MAGKDEVALRKRALIAKANRTMFLWVAAMSVVVGFAAVGSVFLFQRLVFNEKILMEKQTTVNTLRHNNETVQSLQDDVRALNSNEALISVKANESDDALQVILDALPSTPNSLALGASLQNRLLSGIQNLTIEQLQVDAVGEGLDPDAIADTSAVEDGSEGEGDVDAVSSNVIGFRLTVIGNTNALKEVLTRLERSIRTVHITSMTVESRGNAQALVIVAHAFYEPEKAIELRDKAVNP